MVPSINAASVRVSPHLRLWTHCVGRSTVFARQRLCPSIQTVFRALCQVSGPYPHVVQLLNVCSAAPNPLNILSWVSSHPQLLLLLYLLCFTSLNDLFSHAEHWCMGLLHATECISALNSLQDLTNFGSHQPLNNPMKKMMMESW